MLTENRYSLNSVGLHEKSRTNHPGESETRVNSHVRSKRLNSGQHQVSGKPRSLMFVIEALTVGGAEQMVVDLANELSRQGDEVHVTCLTEEGELSVKLSQKVQLHVLDKKPGIDLTIAFKFRRLVKQLNVDVVNSHLWTANTWSRVALWKSGVPVVVTEHNRDIWKRAHNRFIDRALCRCTAKMITVSRDTAEFYHQTVGVPNQLITVVNNGVDTSRYANGRGEDIRSEFADKHEFLIGTVGRLAIAKNHSRLVEASALLVEKGIPLKVIIAGEGDERAVTEAKISELQMESCITLLGERNDIPDILAALDIFVLSSDREGHPLSALEAQSAGTPVVLTDAGGSADAVSQSEQGHGGILVEKSAAALAICIADLATNPDKLKEMSQFAKDYAMKYFDKSLMIERYSVIFDAVQRSGVTCVL